MTILVVREQTAQDETVAALIEVTEPVRAVEGKNFNRLVSADGMEYSFTHGGYYDGWGSRLYASKREFPECSQPTAAEVVSYDPASTSQVTDK